MTIPCVAGRGNKDTPDCLVTMAFELRRNPIILRLPSLEVPESAKRIIVAVTKTLVSEHLRHAMGNQRDASTWMMNKKWLEHARTVARHSVALQLDGNATATENATATSTQPRRCCDCGGEVSHGIDNDHVSIARWTCSGCKKNFPPDTKRQFCVVCHRQACQQCNARQSTTTYLTDRAAKLAEILLRRLSTHIRTRVKAVSKHNHPAFIWTIPRVAALFDHMGIIIPHFSEATDGCLLLSSAAFTKVDPNNCHMEGCYLFYDKFKQRWIRSGKVAGKRANFKRRYHQHLKSAKMGPSSKFYKYYPSKHKKVRYVCEMHCRALQLTVSWANSCLCVDIRPIRPATTKGSSKISVTMLAWLLTDPKKKRMSTPFVVRHVFFAALVRGLQKSYIPPTCKAGRCKAQCGSVLVGVGV